MVNGIVEKLEKLKPEPLAYLVLVTWPDGTEGLLFPRPGNVPIADTEDKGVKDFEIAVEHLTDYTGRLGRAKPKQSLAGTALRLIQFRRIAIIKEHKI